MPWTRRVSVSPPSSWADQNNVYADNISVYLESPGERRYKSTNNLDLRIEKEFRLGSTFRLNAYVDIINVLGNKYSYLSYNEGYWFPDDENTTQGERVLSPNYKEIISFSGTKTFRIGVYLFF